MVESEISSTALSMHPPTESQQQRGIVDRRHGCAQDADPDISQVGQEQTRAIDHFRLFRVAVLWAAASTQVAVEPRKRLFVQLTHRYAVPMGPINEVFRPSKVYTNSIPGVPYLR